jgi:hypothetical protein
MGPAAPTFRKDIRGFRLSLFASLCRPRPHNECVAGVGKASLQIETTSASQETPSGGGGAEISSSGVCMEGKTGRGGNNEGRASTS